MPPTGKVRRQAVCRIPSLPMAEAPVLGAGLNRSESTPACCLLRGWGRSENLGRAKTTGAAAFEFFHARKDFPFGRKILQLAYFRSTGKSAIDRPRIIGIDVFLANHGR
jgi:hypothetical protein